jgi:hypothetical protein
MFLTLVTQSYISAATERPDGGEATCASNEPPVGVHDDGVKKPQCADAGGKAAEVADVSPVALTDFDRGDFHGISSIGRRVSSLHQRM